MFEPPTARSVRPSPLTHPPLSSSRYTPLTGLRGLLAAPWCTPYHRTIMIVSVVNMLAAGLLVVSEPSWDAGLTASITAATINIGVAALLRQQNVVNGLFAAALAIPRTRPVRIRAAAAQIYQLPGGVHVGSAIAATGWFTAYAAMAFTRSPSAAGPAQQASILIVIGAILADLLLMSVWARPQIRERRHDSFEATHRYGGWLCLILFTALTVLHAAAGEGPAGTAILTAANTWILIGLFVITALPWLQIRKVPIRCESPSDHVALLTVDHGRPLPGSPATPWANGTPSRP